MSYLKVENKKVQNNNRPDCMKNSIQIQMNNRFQEGIIIFLTYKTQGKYYISYFVTRFSQFLVQSVIFCCTTLPIKSLPSSHYKPVWIILALTEHVYYRPTALLPCELCTPPMTALIAFITNIPARDLQSG